jgi:hypothetical protein
MLYPVNPRVLQEMLDAAALASQTGDPQAELAQLSLALKAALTRWPELDAERTENAAGIPTNDPEIMHGATITVTVDLERIGTYGVNAAADESVGSFFNRLARERRTGLDRVWMGSTLVGRIDRMAGKTR